MKSIKKLTIVLLGFISFSFTKAQNINNLSVEEFYNEICFDNICLDDIIDTHDTKGNIKTLFSSPALRRVKK